jgi:formylglycine-generating enzyme required for sulfatase activity
LFKELPEFLYIPSGNILLGDRLNPREPHYVWLTGFFVAPFELTNGEFREFLKAPDGYNDDANWTEDGKRWKATNTSHSSALLISHAIDYRRFGRDDQPITWVTWYEATAFCKWLTRKIGGQRWLYTLPNEAEWEKVARGPDGLDYALSMTISDQEIPLYNWKKNPDAPVTVSSIHDTPATYSLSRYGAYHMSGNVVEWTQSINRPYNRLQPFIDDDRNFDGTSGLRVARGGSWYSASIAYLYIPYRDAFQPEHSSQDVGFRIAARALP